MSTLQIKNVKINKRKDGYHFITIPKSYIDNNLVDLDEEYDIEIRVAVKDVSLEIQEE